MMITSGPLATAPFSSDAARASDPSMPALLVGESRATTRERLTAALNCLRRGSIESDREITGDAAIAVPAPTSAVRVPKSSECRKVRFILSRTTWESIGVGTSSRLDSIIRIGRLRVTHKIPYFPTLVSAIAGYGSSPAISRKCTARGSTEFRPFRTVWNPLAWR